MSQERDDNNVKTDVPLSAFEEALKAVESIQRTEQNRKKKSTKQKEKEVEIDLEADAGDLDDLLRYLEAGEKETGSASPAAAGNARRQASDDLKVLSDLLREEKNLEKEAEFLRTVLTDKAAKGETVDKKALEEKQGQIEELHERILRIQAEFNNFKKRIDRDKVDIVRFANENLLLALLPIVDNLERALAHARATNDREAVIDGVELILRQMFDTLATKGLRRMESEQEWFDPAFHEAMATMEVEQVEPGRVVSQYERGYLLHGRLLRPAKVIVAVKPSADRGAASSNENNASTSDA